MPSGAEQDYYDAGPEQRVLREILRERQRHQHLRHEQQGNQGYSPEHLNEHHAHLAANPNSELVILEVTQPYSNHNGGQIAFGPDGKLYIGLGDGGSAGDPFGSGQDTSTLLSSILRVDVSAATEEKPYAIPADNPFANTKMFLRRAQRTPAFWNLIGIHYWGCAGHAIILFYLVAMAEAQGVSQAAAAGTFVALSVTSTLTRFGVPIVADPQEQPPGHRPGRRPEGGGVGNAPAGFGLPPQQVQRLRCNFYLLLVCSCCHYLTPLIEWFNDSASTFSGLATAPFWRPSLPTPCGDG